MQAAEFVSKQINDITSRAKTRAWNELQPGFVPDDHQSIDAPRFVPATTWADSITMRKAMAIPGRCGDHAQK